MSHDAKPKRQFQGKRANPDVEPDENGEVAMNYWRRHIQARIDSGEMPVKIHWTRVKKKIALLIVSGEFKLDPPRELGIVTEDSREHRELGIPVGTRLACSLAVEIIRDDLGER